MFKRKAAVVLEGLAGVETLRRVLAALDQAGVDGRILNAGLEQTRNTIDQLTRDEQEARDAMHRHAILVSLDPANQEKANACHQRMIECQTQRTEAEAQVSAYERELGSLERQGDRLRSELAQARRQAWTDISARLIEEFPSEFIEHFRRLWTALDQIDNGIPAQAVLARLGLGELPTPTKLDVLTGLCDEFNVPNRW